MWIEAAEFRNAHCCYNSCCLNTGDLLSIESAPNWPSSWMPPETRVSIHSNSQVSIHPPT